MTEDRWQGMNNMKRTVIVAALVGAFLPLAGATAYADAGPLPTAIGSATGLALPRETGLQNFLFTSRFNLLDSLTRQSGVLEGA
ncbi:hypothetical protein [Streptomyces sp. NPDC055287]